MNRILVASGNSDAVEILRETLSLTHVVEDLRSEESFAAFLNQDEASRTSYELCFIDLAFLWAMRPPAIKDSLKRVLRQLLARAPGADVVVMTDQAGSRQAVSAVQSGAQDYLIFPLNNQKIVLLKERIESRHRQRSELDFLREGFWKTDSLKIVKTRSPAMETIFRQIRSVAPTLSTVLLCGETGTGKSVLAKLIHFHSSRSDGPFVSLHCGAVPDTLIESELFGHERGAFTGADRRRLGKFEIAKGGAILLDEIGTITPSAQIKLLQVLQERKFYRVGGETPINADVRVIAATNDDLVELTEQGRFRKDLYFRLSVFPLELPPLRERTEDIADLAQEFLARLNLAYGKNIRSVDARVMEAFRKYSWPGNIRELENLLERAYILENSDTLMPESFPTALLAFPAAVAAETHHDIPTLSEARRNSVELAERQYLKEVLNLHHGRISASARTAGISTRQLHKLMKKYGLRKEEFKQSITGTARS